MYFQTTNIIEEAQVIGWRRFPTVAWGRLLFSVAGVSLLFMDHRCTSSFAPPACLMFIPWSSPFFGCGAWPAAYGVRRAMLRRLYGKSLQQHLRSQSLQSRVSNFVRAGLRDVGHCVALFSRRSRVSTQGIGTQHCCSKYGPVSGTSHH
jgi:hypothetical protein